MLTDGLVTLSGVAVKSNEIRLLRLMLRLEVNSGTQRRREQDRQRLLSYCNPDGTVVSHRRRLCAPGRNPQAQPGVKPQMVAASAVPPLGPFACDK